MELTVDTSILDDRFVVEALLGRGGMAAVYLVRHRRLDTLMALKVLLGPSPEARDRLIREGRAQGALHHPNVVPVSDVVDLDGLPGLILEYVNGPPLDRVLADARLSLVQADDLARGILAGVAHAHAAGLVHRDLKPGNVLCALTGRGVVPKVADFGLVKDLGGGDAATRTGVAMGTAAYMPPEQLRDAASVDARADVFALGAILYELVSGVRAFRGADAFELQEAIVYGRFAPVRDLVPDLPDRMADAIGGALVADRAARIGSVAELLRRWEAGTEALHPERTWSAPDLERLARLVPRRGRWAPDTPSEGDQDTRPWDEAVASVATVPPEPEPVSTLASVRPETALAPVSDDARIAWSGLAGGLFGAAVFAAGAVAFVEPLLADRAVGTLAAGVLVAGLLGPAAAGWFAATRAEAPLRAATWAGAWAGAFAWGSLGVTTFGAIPLQGWLQYALSGGRGLSEDAMALELAAGMAGSAWVVFGGLPGFVVASAAAGAGAARLAGHPARWGDSSPDDATRAAPLQIGVLLSVPALVALLGLNTLSASALEALRAQGQVAADVVVAGLGLANVGTVAVVGSLLAASAGAIVRSWRRGRRWGAVLAGLLVLPSLFLMGATPASVRVLAAISVCAVTWVAGWRAARAPLPAEAATPRASAVGAAAALVAMVVVGPLIAFGAAAGLLLVSGIEPIQAGRPLPRAVLEGLFGAVTAAALALVAVVLLQAQVAAGLSAAEHGARAARPRGRLAMVRAAMPGLGVTAASVAWMLPVLFGFRMLPEREPPDPPSWPEARSVGAEGPYLGGSQALLDADPSGPRALLDAEDGSLWFEAAVVRALLIELADLDARPAWAQVQGLAAGRDDALARVLSGGEAEAMDPLVAALRGWQAATGAGGAPDVVEPLFEQGRKVVLPHLWAVRTEAGPGVPGRAALQRADARFTEAQAWFGALPAPLLAERIWLHLRAGDAAAAREVARGLDDAALEDPWLAATALAAALDRGDEALTARSEAALSAAMGSSKTSQQRAARWAAARAAAGYAAVGRFDEARRWLSEGPPGLVDARRRELEVAAGGPDPGGPEPQDACGRMAFRAGPSDAPDPLVLDPAGPCDHAGWHAMWRRAAAR